MQSKPLSGEIALSLAVDTVGDADAALTTTHAIASVGIATLKMLETLLPAAASEVEKESKALTDNFMKLVAYTLDGATPPPQISETISKIIVGMQFQDRNTQIMDNVTCILERYRNMLEDICSNISTLREEHIHGGHTISDAVEGILSSIRLSDIRTRYLEALKKARVSSHEKGASSEVSEPASNEVELF